VARRRLGGLVWGKGPETRYALAYGQRSHVGAPSWAVSFPVPPAQEGTSQEPGEPTRRELGCR